MQILYLTIATPLKNIWKRQAIGWIDVLNIPMLTSGLLSARFAADDRPVINSDEASVLLKKAVEDSFEFLLSCNSIEPVELSGPILRLKSKLSSYIFQI